MALVDKVKDLMEENPLSSMAEIITKLGEEDARAWMSVLTEEQQANLMYDADFWLRPKQKVPTKGDWFITALVAGRGFGKLLNCMEILPTPEGWVKLEDIKDGDIIFDENGDPCTVIKAHDIKLPEKAYKLTFADGSELIAGGEHLWTTWTHSDRKSFNHRNEYIDSGDNFVGLPENWPTWTKGDRWGKPTSIGPKTRTTQEIVDTFRHGKRGDLNHSIPVTMPLKYTEKELPVDPYLYGVFIGDGIAKTGSITSHTDESDWMVSQFTSRGYTDYTVKGRINTDGTVKNCNTLNFRGFRGDLRANGLLGVKVIPDIYLRGSIEQRKDMVAGMLDTDGYIDPKTHYVEFVSMTEHHALVMKELAMSLGQKPRIYEGRATLNGKDYGTKYRVCWRPTYNPFKMPRKMANYVGQDAQASRNMHRMISSFEEIEPIPMRCLTVDSPNNLFLVGESMIPTHNTRTMTEWIRKFVKENPGCRIAIAGRTAADVRNTMVTGQSGLLAITPEHERPVWKKMESSLEWPNGSKAQLLSSEVPDAARGPEFHAAVGDEFAAWKSTPDASGATLYDNLIAATRLGKNPKILLGTTPKRTRTMKDIIERAKDPDEGIILISGSTYENTSLSSSYIKNFERQYGDSDLAKQEIEGKMLEDAEGLVFTDSIMEKSRLIEGEVIPKNLIKIIAVDPTVSQDPKNADECGIMVIGATRHSDPLDRKAYLLEDLSLKATPDEWVDVIVEAGRRHGIRNVVAERNQGGDLIRAVIQAKDSSMKVHTVWASKGKLKRVEPIVVVMQQGRVKFYGEYPELEDQLVYYDPEISGYSPDRMDAFVWGVTALLVAPPETLRFGVLRTSKPKGQSSVPTNMKSAGKHQRLPVNLRR